MHRAGHVEPSDGSDLIGREVTAIVPAPRAPERMRIKIGRRTAAELDRADVEHLELRVGTVWSDALARRAESAAEIERARRAVLRVLARRAASRRQIAEKLRLAGFSAEAAEAALAHFQAQGLIDDDAYAEAAARSIVARKATGRELLVSSLRARGVDAETARRAAAAALEDRDVAADALTLARQKARSMPADLDEHARRRRVYAQLARRGFSPEVCRNAVDQALGVGQGSDPD